MKITRITIKNLYGIRALDVELGAAGALISGDNGMGKTSVLRAIRAALAGQGLDEHAVRDGAEAGEVIVDVDQVIHVRQRASRAKRQPKLEVLQAGVAWDSPRTRLKELGLVQCAIDPVRLMEAADGAERQRLVMEASPCEITMEDVIEVLGIEEPATITLPCPLEPGVHGLVMAAKLRKSAAEERAKRNRAVEEVAERQRAAERDLQEKPPAFAGDAPTVEQVEDEMDSVWQSITDARWQVERAAKAREAQAQTRERIEQLDEERIALETADEPSEIELGAARSALDACRSKVAAAQQALAEAQVEEHRARDVYTSLVSKQTEARGQQRRAQQLAAQIADLRASLVEVHAPSAADIAAAEARYAVLRDEQKLAREHEAHEAAARAVQALAAELEEKLRAAKAADDIVHAIDKLPAVLARRALPEGISFVDGDVALDGHTFANLSGREAMLLAVEVARRANARTKIIVTDRTEVIAPGRFDEFLQLATRDGYQLIATRVADGDLVIEALEP